LGLVLEEFANIDRYIDTESAPSANNIDITHIVVDHVYACPSTLSHTGPDVVRFQHSCYELVSTPTVWNGAKQICSGRHGELVQITDSATQEFLLAAVVTRGWSSQYAWIGAYDILISGLWTWTKGKPSNTECYRMLPSVLACSSIVCYNYDIEASCIC
jgi:hypothetical protein